jgi:hypothetical protein
MPFFGPSFDRGAEGESRLNPLSAVGRRVDPLDIPGAMERRARLFGEAIEIAKRGGDVRPGIANLLAKKSQLIKWVSLRGALSYVSITLEQSGRTLGDLRGYAGQAEPDGALDLIRSYESRVSKLRFAEVLADPSLVKSIDWHLDFITWAAVAHVQGGLDRFLVIPAAQVLDVPAWYREPVFGKAERYWDGADWTTKVRVLDGRRWALVDGPL